MSGIEITVGDFWITKRHPIECEVTQIDVDDDTTWVTSYSKDDDEYDTVSKHDFLRDYTFLRKGGKADMVNHPVAIGDVWVDKIDKSTLKILMLIMKALCALTILNYSLGKPSPTTQ